MILEESLVGSPLVQIVWQRLQVDHLILARQYIMYHVMCWECLGGCPSKGQRSRGRSAVTVLSIDIFGTITPHLGYEPIGISVEWYSHGGTEY